MWGDVIIGKGEKGNTAVRVFAIPGEHSISQNGVSFWIYNCIVGTGITIFKNTAEGKKLQEMIENGTSLDDIQEWIDQIVLRNIDVKKLKRLIDMSNKDAFNKGKEAKALEIRDVLGL